jgi:hypothetical protein
MSSFQLRLSDPEIGNRLLLFFIRMPTHMPTQFLADRELQRESNAISKLLRADCASTAHRFYGDCTSTAQRLRSDCAAISRRLHSDCEATGKRFRCAAIAKLKRMDRVSCKVNEMR